MSSEVYDKLPKEVSNHCEFTSIQLSLMEILSDGKPHSRSDLKEAVDGEYTSDDTIKKHIGATRRKLHEVGYLIMLQFEQGKPLYRLCKEVDIP